MSFIKDHTLKASGYEARLTPSMPPIRIKDIDEMPIYTHPYNDTLCFYKDKKPESDSDGHHTFMTASRVVVSNMVGAYFAEKKIRKEVYGVGTMPEDTIRDGRGQIIVNKKLEKYC